MIDEKCGEIKRSFLSLLHRSCSYFVQWYLAKTIPIPKIVGTPRPIRIPPLKIAALEDQEREARPLDCWEPTDSDDSDQANEEQQLPLPAVLRGRHAISASDVNDLSLPLVHSVQEVDECYS